MGNVPDQIEGASKRAEEAESQEMEKSKTRKGVCGGGGGGGDGSIEGAVNLQPLRSVCVSEYDSEYERE